MRRFVKLLAWGSLLLSLEASALNPPPFPRLGSMWISSQSYQTPAIQQSLARDNIVVILTWPGWSSYAGMPLQTVIQNIKKINPNTMVFEYTINSAVATVQPNSVWQPLYNKLNAMNWWLYQSGTSGTQTSAWPNMVDTNYTAFVPKDSNGDDWNTWYAKWNVATYYTPNPALDGFYFDNFSLKPLDTADWQRNGTTTDPSYPQAAQWIQAGNLEYLNATRQALPGHYITANISSWGDPSVSVNPYQGQMNGGFIEGLVGFSWSPETWGGWTTMMAWYRKAMGALADPKLAMFHQVGAANDYQGFRYGLASCLMDEGYFSYNGSQAYSDSPDFDEYHNPLGAETSAPATAAWQKGVYRRDFQNGIALVNPKGNGPQTVTLETTYQHIAGTQVPTINNGQSVTTVTLQDRDGIILLRLNPAKKPAPPSAVTAKP